MSRRRKFKKWLIKLEKAPTTKKIRTLLIFFCAALISGGFFSSILNLYQRAILKNISRDIRAIEIKRMDERIEQYKSFQYVRG